MQTQAIAMAQKIKSTSIPDLTALYKELKAPLPTLNTGESKKEFTSRCMANPTMIQDFPDTKQRLAVCNLQYKKSR